MVYLAKDVQPELVVDVALACLNDELDQAPINLYRTVMTTFAQDRSIRLAQFAGRRRRLRISRRPS